MSDLTLSEFDAELTVFLCEKFLASGRAELAEELGRVVIPVQGIGGDERAFSFMAFAMPRLSNDERATMDLRDEESCTFEREGGSIRVDLDQFGKVNWVHISGFEGLHEKLKSYLDARRASGDVKPFWSY